MKKIHVRMRVGRRENEDEGTKISMDSFITDDEEIGGRGLTDEDLRIKGGERKKKSLGRRKRIQENRV